MQTLSGRLDSQLWISAYFLSSLVSPLSSSSAEDLLTAVLLFVTAGWSLEMEMLVVGLGVVVVLVGVALASSCWEVMKCHWR